ncbi:MAG: hypothetical protein KC620_24045, partial [Myxococcales bacterium]|nr:hypothetical protein [Myxococcales bacterium]
MSKKTWIILIVIAVLVVIAVGYFYGIGPAAGLFSALGGGGGLLSRQQKKKLLDDSAAAERKANAARAEAEDAAEAMGAARVEANAYVDRTRADAAAAAGND